MAMTATTFRGTRDLFLLFVQGKEMTKNTIHFIFQDGNITVLKGLIYFLLSYGMTQKRVEGRSDEQMTMRFHITTVMFHLVMITEKRHANNCWNANYFHSQMTFIT